MRYLSSSNINQLLRGASILAGGGGGSYESAMDQFPNSLSVEVRDLRDFHEAATIVTVFGLGPVDSSSDENLRVAERSAELYEQQYSEIDGIILGELGPELIVEAALVAQRLNIPVVNADVGGMRAVPSIQNEIIEESEIERTPVICTDGEESIFIEDVEIGLELEQRIRELAEDGIWNVTGYEATAAVYREAAAEGWFEECMNPLDGRAETHILGNGTVEDVETQSIDGHTVGRITVEGKSTYQVFFRNENLLVLEDGENVAEAPETITLVDEEGIGIYNGDLPEEGQNFTLVGIRYPDIWTSERRENFNLETGFSIASGTVSIGSNQSFEIGTESIDFIKIQSLGNDFIVLDGQDQDIDSDRARSLAPEFCERRFGIGANDLLFLQDSDEADVRMRVFEPDGSEAEMCGNGIRCIAQYLESQGYSFPVRVETETGILETQLEGGDFRVDMGEPDFERHNFTSSNTEEFMVNERFEIDGREFDISGVSTGEPHLVVFTDNLDEVEVERWGRAIRNSDLAPEGGVNVNFVEIISESRIRVRTYERGVEEETLACGTGSTASALIAWRTEGIEENLVVETCGGTLEVIFQEERPILVGSAETVFIGQLSLEDQ